MPFPNFHTARQEQPGKFKKGSFRTVHPKGRPDVDIVVGKKKGEKKMSAQSIRFSKKTHTAKQAKTSLKKSGAKRTAVTPAKESAWNTFCPLCLEATAESLHPIVDRENGIIKNLCIIGPESRFKGGKLRRLYSESCLSEAVPKYEGAKVNIDHPFAHDMTLDREFDKRFGKFVNVRMVGRRMYGDLKYLTTHPLAERVCEAASRSDLWDMCGFSHVADLDTTWRDGVETVHHIRSVRSVDLVADPATTRSLCESQGGSMKDDKECLENVDDPTGANAVPGDATTAVEQEPVGAGVETEPLDVVVDALISKFMAGDIDAKELKKKFGKVVDLFTDEPEPAADDAGSDKSEKGSDGPPKKDDKAKEESRISTDDAMTVLESAGVPITRIRLKALCGLESEQDRKAFVESLKTTTETGKPRSGFYKPNSTAKIAIESQSGSYSDTKEISQHMFRR